MKKRFSKTTYLILTVAFFSFSYGILLAAEAPQNLPTLDQFLKENKELTESFLRNRNIPTMSAGSNNTESQNSVPIMSAGPNDSPAPITTTEYKGFFNPGSVSEKKVEPICGPNYNGNEYCLLAPINPNYPTVPVTGDGFALYVGTLFYYMMGFAGVFTVVSLVIGGVEYIGAGTSIVKKQDADRRITKAFTGLGLALVSYLILYTINPELVNFRLEIPKIPIKSKNYVSRLPDTIPKGEIQTPVSESTNPRYKELATTQTGAENTARSELKAIPGVNVQITRAQSCGGLSFSEYTRLTGEGCSDFANLKDTTFNGLRELANNCKGPTGEICTFVFTAGNEAGHSTTGGHNAGYSVDMRSDREGEVLSQFIRSKGTATSQSNGNTVYTFPDIPELNGVRFVDEKIGGTAAHWHINFEKYNPS